MTTATTPADQAFPVDDYLAAFKDLITQIAKKREFPLEPERLELMAHDCTEVAKNYNLGEALLLSEAIQGLTYGQAMTMAGQQAGETPDAA